MKLRKILKPLCVSLALLTCVPLTSCGSFFETGDESKMIQEIATEVLENGDTKITITFTEEEKEPLVFVVPKGEDGAQGENGNGIASINQTMSEDGQTLILTITFTDGSEPKVIEVPVINGEDGVSISNITTTQDEQGNTLVTISFNGDIEDVTFTIPAGQKGDTGNGISNVEVITNDDGSQTITISYTDSSMPNTIVTIPAPEKGDPGVGISYIISSESENEYILTFYFTDGSTQEVSFSKPTQPSTWLSGFSEPSSSIGNDGDFYLNKSNLTIYQKVNGTWMLIAQLSSSQDRHTVRFDANGGTFSSDTFSTIFEVTHGETFYGNPNYIFPHVTNGDLKFLGWYTSINQNDPTVGKFTDLTPVYSDMTLYAWWE